MDLSVSSFRQRYPLSLCTALLYLLFFAAYLWFPDIHRRLIVEDEFGENLQFLHYFAAAVFFILEGRTASGLRRARAFALAVGSLLLTGEEVSWFTRLFGFEWQWLASQTTQGSADFHNLIDLYGRRWVYLGFFAAQAVVVPALEKKFFSRAGDFVFARKDYGMAMALSAVLAGACMWGNVIFFYEFSELVFAWALCFSAMRGWNGRAKAAVGLLCFSAAQGMVLFGAGDPTVLNYGGLEYGRRGGH